MSKGHGAVQRDALTVITRHGIDHPANDDDDTRYANVHRPTSWLAVIDVAAIVYGYDPTASNPRHTERPTESQVVSVRRAVKRLAADHLVQLDTGYAMRPRVELGPFSTYKGLRLTLLVRLAGVPEWTPEHAQRWQTIEARRAAQPEPAPMRISIPSTLGSRPSTPAVQ